VPIVTFLTLGIIPTVGKGYDGVRVTLAAPATGRTLEIRIDRRTCHHRLGRRRPARLGGVGSRERL